MSFLALLSRLAFIAVAISLCLAGTADASVHLTFASGVLQLTSDDEGDDIEFDWYLSSHRKAVIADWRVDSQSGCTSNGYGYLVCDGVTEVRFEGGGGDDSFDPRSFFGASITAHGGRGNDRLTASFSADRLFGDEGNDALSDTYTPRGEPGDDVFDGGPGTDVLGAGSAGQVTIVLPEPGATTVGNGDASGSDAITAIENVEGGDANDTITGNSGPNVISGGMGRDTLTGLGGDDVISGYREATSDSLIYNNADTIDAGPGDDRVYSRDTNDEDLACGTGADRVHSDTKLDRLSGCELVALEVFGRLRFEGTPQVGQTLTMTGVDLLGSPTVLSTFVWKRCTPYPTCEVISTDPALQLTADLVGSRVELFGEATYTNGFEAEHATAGPMGSIRPAPAPTASPSPTSSGASSPSLPTGGTTAPPQVRPAESPFSASAAAAGVLGQPTVSLGGGAGPVEVFRGRKAPGLSRARGAVPVAAVACARDRCAVVLRIDLRVGTRRLARWNLRVEVPARSARAVTVSAPASVRRLVRRAGGARLAVTVRTGSTAGAPARFTLPVR